MSSGQRGALVTGDEEHVIRPQGQLPPDAHHPGI